MQPAPQDLPALFHIVSDGQWAQAVADGQLRPASLDTEGFVHCSFAGQLPGTLARHFPGSDGLLVLQIDPAAVAAPVLVEDSYGTGQAFPHVYGPVPVAAVVAVTPADAVSPA